MECEAYKNGHCMSGCGANFEEIDKNKFEYYETQKECQTLKKYREAKHG